MVRPHVWCHLSFVVPSTSDATMDLLNGLLHPNFKKRLSAEEALNQLKVEEDVTRRVPRGFSGKPKTAIRG